MNKRNLEVAIAEAKRFLQKAEELHEKNTHSGQYYYASKETGAARRSSMDLTRALADFRRSGD